MIGNACMSPNCAYYLQPLKPAEFSDHMRLWRRASACAFPLHCSNSAQTEENDLGDL